MVELVAPLEAARPLVGHLAAVSPAPLALGIGFQCLKLAALGGVWLRILRAALPASRIRARDALTPYLAGTGVNAVVPAKAGHATRLVLARRLIPAATYETLAGTMVAEGLLGLVPMVLLLGVAMATGLLPRALNGASIAPPAWMTVPGPWVAAGAALALVALAPVLARGRARRRLAEAARRVRRGLAILTQGRALGPALLGQFAAWSFRLASIACFLAAFGIAPTASLVALVVLAQVLATLIPIAPSGVGAQQGLIVLVLGGVASTSTALAFGVGMQAAVLVVDVAAGLVAVGLCCGWSTVLRRGPAPAPLPEIAAAGGG